MGHVIEKEINMTVGDRKTLVYTKSRNQIHVILSPKLVEMAGFKPGEKVHISYEKNKISIEKEAIELCIR